jgi:hypothetical protein
LCLLRPVVPLQMVSRVDGLLELALHLADGSITLVQLNSNRGVGEKVTG